MILYLRHQLEFDLVSENLIIDGRRDSIQENDFTRRILHAGAPGVS